MVQSGFAVGGEFVLDQNNVLHVGVNRREAFQGVSIVHTAAPVGHPHLTRPGQGLDPAKEVGYFTAFVFAVFAFDPSSSGLDGLRDVVDQLTGLLVKAHHCT